MHEKCTLEYDIYYIFVLCITDQNITYITYVFIGSNLIGRSTKNIFKWVSLPWRLDWKIVNRKVQKIMQQNDLFWQKVAKDTTIMRLNLFLKPDLLEYIIEFEDS